MSSITLPVGKDDFTKLREGNYYYIDKTMLIKHIVDIGAEATLITRPRRFGKSLNMSMLDCFFDITKKNTDELFKGLNIWNETDILNNWKNQYPTISISFKNVEGLTFEQSFKELQFVISNCFKKYLYLLQSDKIDEMSKNLFNEIYFRKTDDVSITEALLLLSEMLYIYHDKKVIILIDEYDVPMSKGNTYDYYVDITRVIRSILNKALKGNENLQFGVVTGCLRIAKESIFTGLNNPAVDSISDERSDGFDEYFGFTNSEVDKLLADTELTEKKQIIKEWYDGYRYGDVDVYCPWDVVCYVSRLIHNPNAQPKTFWSNTTGSDIIRPFLSKNRRKISGSLNTLIGGGTVTANINEKLTYEDLNDNEINHFWSLLYLTGYLTPESVDTKTNEFNLKIPNKELQIIFRESVSNWYKHEIIPPTLDEIIRQMWSYDAPGLTKTFTNLLQKSISGYDYSENFYHAFILGIMTLTPYEVKSNRETGEGRTDIYIADDDKVILIEFKIAKDSKKMEKRADDALLQIKNKRYAEEFISDGFTEIIKMGVGFFKKQCVVKIEKVI